MNRLVKSAVVGDALGLLAVGIFVATMLAASLWWSERPGPVGALGVLPLILLVAFYVRRRRRTTWTGRGDALP